MAWYWYVIVALTVFDLGFLLGAVWLTGRRGATTGYLIAYPSLDAGYLQDARTRHRLSVISGVHD